MTADRRIPPILTLPVRRSALAIVVAVLLVGCADDRPPRDPARSAEAARLFEACMAREGVPVEDVEFDIDIRGRWQSSGWRPQDPSQRGNSPEVTAINQRCDQVILDRFPS